MIFNDSNYVFRDTLKFEQSSWPILLGYVLFEILIFFQNSAVYWPTDKEKPIEFGPLKVTLKNQNSENKDTSIIIREFEISNSGKVYVFLNKSI